MRASGTTRFGLSLDSSKHLLISHSKSIPSDPPLPKLDYRILKGEKCAADVSPFQPISILSLPDKCRRQSLPNIRLRFTNGDIFSMTVVRHILSQHFEEMGIFRQILWSHAMGTETVISLHNHNGQIPEESIRARGQQMDGLHCKAGEWVLELEKLGDMAIHRRSRLFLR
ncbi:MAG: hypothetical protein L6R42_005578 [Xanthoria sp. 1 TBL-2021]|nr:MAG: hypothetical protein L6R42_005578 [Xanthoria sp. 1 TBL-2021]